MTITNNFLDFCATDTGTNLLTESEYLASTDRTSGNKPGVASSKLVNKAIRQSSYITAQLAQYIGEKTNTDILDDATPAKLLSQIYAAVYPLSPVINRYLSGSGNHNTTYYFFIAAGNATASAVYTNSTFSFTVVTTISAGTILRTTGTGDPGYSGVLTKSSGTGDATLTFYAFRKPVETQVYLVGGGGGGGGAISGGGAGGTGGNSTFGTSLLIANGGGGGGAAGSPATAGGTVTVNSPALTTIALPGGTGTVPDTLDGGVTNWYAGGGSGASGPWGGGGGGQVSALGTNGATNSGSGGGGGGTVVRTGVIGNTGGTGGSAGGFIFASIPSPSGSYPYVIGAAGTSGAGASGGYSGGTGGSGIGVAIEKF
jgi:hypothetical protein